MAKENFGNYNILKTQENQEISDFPKIMRRLYGENISLSFKDTEGYRFKDVNLFINFEDGIYSVRIFGNGKARRNLISKLENTTGFVLKGYKK